jgi:hypothetical protein
MQNRAMLIVSIAGALLVPLASAAYAQNSPVPNSPVPSNPGPASPGAPSPTGPGVASAPAAVTAADVQAFVSNPAAYIASVPVVGDALKQRIQQLLAVAAQNGQLSEVLAGLNTVGSIPGITSQQLSAIVAGANAAAADFAAAQNLEAQRAIQVAVAANPALSNAQQALALATPAANQTQVPATADLGPAGGLTGGGAQTSAIGGAGSTAGGGTGGSSATSSGTTGGTAGGTGIASGTGSFSGASGSGRSSNNNGSSGSGTGTVDTSPIVRL